MVKAASCQPTTYRALGPVIVITIVDAVLLANAVSEMSHLGWAAWVSPRLQVVSSVGIVARE